MRIKDVIHAKASQDVVTITPEATVRELIALLAQHNVGALVVSEDGERVAGIVSERDVVRRLHEDESVLDSPVSRIMTADVHTCTAEDPLTCVARGTGRVAEALQQYERALAGGQPRRQVVRASSF